MRTVLLGAPGAGKGTQAKFVAEHFSVPTISTGDIFRANLADDTDLGKEAKRYMDAGDLVPDEVTIAIVRDRLAQDDTDNGFVLDGFPRTVHQAEELNSMLSELGDPLDVVLELQVDEAEVVRRLSGRRTCSNCGHIWHVEFDPPATDGECDNCGGELVQRDDDRPETVRRRIEVYNEQTSPLVGFYTELGLLKTISAEGKVEEITGRAIEALTTATRA